VELQFLFGNPIVHKLENKNIYMSVPFGQAVRAFTSGLLRGETLNHHNVTMGSSSEPSYLGNPITSTDKLLGHVCFMGKIFKIFKSKPYSACHLT